jgi:quercetin 2,3-dioxygenase
MIEHRPFASLAGDELAWLSARRHLPCRWGALRAWNDDEIAPHGGFPSHAHANMEIITYVREGAITHRDSLGNVCQTRAGNVQVMSAGTGIRHAEYNLEPTPTRIFQIWIAPDRSGGAPAWGTKPFPTGHCAGRLVALASGYDSDTEALPIRARARVLAATLRAGEYLEYRFEPNRMSYLVVARGRLDVNGVSLDARDGAAIKDVAVISVDARLDAELVLVDVSA